MSILEEILAWESLTFLMASWPVCSADRKLNGLWLLRRFVQGCTQQQMVDKVSGQHS